MSDFNPHALVDRLQRGAGAINALVGVVNEEDALWRPEDGAWSINEIVWHLADEEAEDFRARLSLTLEDPKQAWPGIDPEGAAKDRNYQGKSLAEGLRIFTNQRGVSIAWLRSLRGIQWENTYSHSAIGDISAGDLLASWVAHDALHMRQISKRLFQLTVRDAGKYSTAYAGDW